MFVCMECMIIILRGKKCVNDKGCSVSVSVCMYVCVRRTYACVCVRLNATFLELGVLAGVTLAAASPSLYGVLGPVSPPSAEPNIYEEEERRS